MGYPAAGNILAILTHGCYPLGYALSDLLREVLMSVFDEEDTATLKILGYTGIGFAILTVALILLALVIT